MLLHQNSIVCIVHVVNYDMSKFGFKILKLLNLKWKIASNITCFILIAGRCTLIHILNLDNNGK
jgi:hypothetical protein